MSNIQKIDQVSASTLEKVLIKGDLAALTEPQRVEYYSAVCKSVGLNPLTKPFDYINLNGKLTLYAKRDCTDQLRKISGVSVYKIEKEKIDDIYVVTAYGKDTTGREDSATGAVTVSNLKGDALANAFMKAETKAKRRLTLSLCGLGLLDETEVETIPEATKPSEPKNVTPIINEPKFESPFDHETFETYVIPFGKWKGQKLVDINVLEVSNYYAFIEKDAKDKKAEIKGQVKAFMVHAKDFMNSRSATGEDVIA